MRVVELLLSRLRRLIWTDCAQIWCAPIAEPIVSATANLQDEAIIAPALRAVL